MFLKLVLLIAVVYLVYRAFGGKISLPKKKNKEPKELDENTLIECSSCSVYITKKESIKRGGKYYCNECAR